MPTPAIPHPHATPAGEVAAALGTDPAQGLDGAQVAARQSEFGPNILRLQAPRSLLSLLVHQVESVIVWLLGAAAILSFALGDMAEAAAILAVLLINGAIGFFTELRAARSMEALLSIAQLHSRVRREGVERLIAADQLVPGDIVILEAGDIVTCDLRLSAASHLQVDESVLTGESMPVPKSPAPAPAEAGIGDRRSMAFKGSAITQGEGEGVVVATGMATELGRISDLAQKAKGEAAPLDRRLDRLGQRLVWLTLALAVLAIGAGLLRGYDLAEMIKTGVALAVAAVPEGLPVVATLTLARGMWRMSARNALITRLSSVETLGATTVILTDKTGTLTENRMSVARYLIDGGDVELVAQDDALVMARNGQGLDMPENGPLAWALRVGALCNSAHLGDGPGAEAGAGEPMELALLQAARGAGFSNAALAREWPEIGKHAFHPEHKMMATLHRDGAGRLFAVKGAPEAVLDACTQVMTATGDIAPLSADALQAWRERAASAARDGLRLLALALKRNPRDGEKPYRDLVLLGLVGLRDPIRPDVPAAIAASRAAGVRVVMLTGDHADTARTIAAQAGLGRERPLVIEGAELAGIDPDRLSDDQRARILSADVFARVAPETKLALVSIFQRAGHVVAMTGDGVNDAPALKKADIGIAMGLRGTEVAKQAAHMVLRDDAFGSIIVAMRQGRVIFGNIRSFVIYLMSCNVSEVLVVGLAVAGGLPVPLLPLQILYLNLVTDVFPAFALGFGRGDKQVMARPPRDPSEPIIARAHWTAVAVLGGAITLATLGAFWLSLEWLGHDTGPAITVAFLTLALAQLWNVFNLRKPDAGRIVNDVTANPYVWAATALCLCLIGGAIWHPGLAGLLRLDWPGIEGIGLAACASLAPLILGQIWLETRRRPRQNQPGIGAP